jgi:hypothetical protein
VTKQFIAQQKNKSNKKIQKKKKKKKMGFGSGEPKNSAHLQLTR